MPAMKGKLRETEVVQLALLVREFRGGRQLIPDEPEDEKDSAKSSEGKKMTARENSAVGIPPSGSAAVSAHVNQQADAGRGIFRRFCTSCHGSDGRGTTLRYQTPSIPDFTSQVWQQRRSAPGKKCDLVQTGRAHAALVFGGGAAIAAIRWCQFGSADELPRT